MFTDPKVRPLIESAGHVYDSTIITSYFQKIKLIGIYWGVIPFLLYKEIKNHLLGTNF